MNKPVAWSYEKLGSMERQAMDLADELSMECTQVGVEAARLLRMLAITVYMQGEEIAKCCTHPVKELTDDDIAKVVHELNQKANTPERWVTAMEIGAETIIQLRDELAILRKAQEK